MSTVFTGRKLHLIGVGGVGMSGLAIAAQQLGADVTGSDREASSYTARLEQAGISVKIGQAAANLPEGAEVVISTAILDSNPELAAAREQRRKILHRSELLAELAATKPRCIAVAGSHGKTTTTAMIAHVLERLELKPSYFVGGEVTIGKRTTNAHLDDGDVVVIEADESDGSFLRYHPEIAVITNIEFEHPETWSGLDELIAAFRELAGNAKSVVISADQPRIDELALGDRATTFAPAPIAADLQATTITTPEDPALGSAFELGEEVIELGVRGEHNVKNALAAIAAVELVGVSRNDAAAALKSFVGVGRRFELIGETANGAVVYDDYAHHQTEIRAALTTARQTAQGGRVIAVFLPHLYSRTMSYAREFGESLTLADVVIVNDIYPARERAEDFPGITGWLIATRTADAAPGKPVYYEPTFDDAVELLERILEPGDLCITIGAGDVYRVANRLTGRTP
ncbi:MAG: UDP-N-acetylmuramate--L-alanine ligase [Solirubrobacterales bacterium]|nr:UDP-N-acetylmuramate--L-alanine ligase [Solirubrobacterales bacterium]